MVVKAFTVAEDPVSVLYTSFWLKNLENTSRKSTIEAFEKLKEMKKKIDTDMANIKLLRQYLWRNDNASKSL